MSQAYEATAGLIGNTLVALGADRRTREAVTANPDVLASVVDEVLRYDPPIQNTRRFLARDGIVAGRDMKTGDAVLVVRLITSGVDPAPLARSVRYRPSANARIPAFSRRG